MFTIGRKVSFSVVVALLLGWGIFGLLFMQASTTLLQAQTYELDRPVPLPSGVKLNLQVDKKVYRAGETVLIALRNDSRLTMWLAEHTDGCAGSWWQVEMLDADGTTWSTVSLSKQTCSTATYGQVRLTRHSLQTAEWPSVVPSEQIGDIVRPAPLGTYRIMVRYLTGKTIQAADWTGDRVHTVVSPSFTIQSAAVDR